MYAAVRRYEGINDDDEAARLVRDSFMPQLEKVPGFVAYYWIDAGDGLMASRSVFEDKAGADESVKFAHKWIERTPNLFPNPPEVTEGLVISTRGNASKSRVAPPQDLPDQERPASADRQIWRSRALASAKRTLIAGSLATWGRRGPSLCRRSATAECVRTRRSVRDD
jgi:hypothetical protein